MNAVEEVRSWTDEQGRHPLSDDANTIKKRKADKVLRVLRTYRVVVTTEEAFLHFVKSWADWMGSLDLDPRLVMAA
ncbi:hypothetical protein [Mesorhizobium temperatum]|uniref:hypothetical protein n=1 Tax=Mesorhizobium temperatum TaxID=241416 RepID=UPI0019804D58|nr:hypothetical protein [Mesorhizobium temperatum]